MGVGFIILFYATLLGLIIAASGGFYLILHFLSKTDPGAAALKKDFGKFAFACLAIFILLGSVFAAQAAMDLFIPSRVFSKSFGASPAADVAGLSGYRFLLGDGGESRLEFYAERETVERIIAENDFVAITERFGLRPNDHEFARMITIPGVRIYKSSRIKGSGFVSNTAYLLYDQDSGQVYYSWVGID